MDADYADNIMLLANTSTQVSLHSLEQAAGGIGLHVNVNKTEYMCFNQKGDISTLNGGSMKLVDKFTYLRSSILSTENDVYVLLVKAWTAVDRFLIIWKTNLSEKTKCNFFQAAVMLVLQYGCTRWMLTKHREKKPDRSCTRMLWVILK